MRKTLALFLALFTLLFSVYCTVFTSVNKEKDNVVITEIFNYGEKSVTDKLKINIKNLYRENLLWDTTYNINDGSADTEFSIYTDRIPREYEIHKDFRIYTSFHKSISGPHTFEEYTGLEKAYKELIDSAEPGKETKKIILISDYLDYYPINVEASFPGKYIDSYSSYSEHETDSSVKELIKSLSDFFRIPIIEDHKIELRATVSEDGTVYQSGTTSGCGLGEDEDDYGFFAKSIITDKECFIYFNNKTELGKTVDTQNIPGGYGIYRLPYSTVNEKTTFDTDKLKNIYPINCDYTIHDLDISKDGKNIFMITYEDGKCVYTKINAESFETLEKIIVTEDKDESAYIEYIEDDFIVLNIYHPNRDSKLSVFTFDANGKTNEEITVPNYIEIQKKNSPRYIGADVYEHSEIDAVWDKGRLYVTNPFDNTTDRPVTQNGFRLTVFGKGGIEFYGEYITSLSTGNDGYQASSYHINNSMYDKIDIILN